MSADASMESFAPEHHDEEADHEDRGMEVDAREVGADDVPAQEEGSDHEEEKDEEVCYSFLNAAVGLAYSSNSMRMVCGAQIWRCSVSEIISKRGC